MHTEYPKYVDEKFVSDLTGMSLSTIRNHRFERRGMPFIKVNHGRSVRYLLSDVIAFMEAGRIQTGENA